MLWIVAAASLFAIAVVLLLLHRRVKKKLEREIAFWRIAEISFPFHHSPRTLAAVLLIIVVCVDEERIAYGRKGNP
jgi:hypothetical protein